MADWQEIAIKCSTGRMVLRCLCNKPATQSGIAVSQTQSLVDGCPWQCLPFQAQKSAFRNYLVKAVLWKPVHIYNNVRRLVSLDHRRTGHVNRF